MGSDKKGFFDGSDLSDNWTGLSYRKETSPFSHTPLSRTFSMRGNVATKKGGITDGKEKGEVVERCFLLEFYKKVV